MNNQLTITNLKKTYASGVTALKGVNLEIPAGMFGLLGPNGAGKTTLMKILATLLEPDEGNAELQNLDLIRNQAATRKLLGYLPQEFGLYPTLTAEQMLDYFAKLKGVHNRSERSALIDALLERVNLESARHQKVGGFSGGMRQRLGIAQAIIGQAKLLIVDEPTAGLDPDERVRFHNLLSEIASDDTIVILSTHIVSDIASLCSRMAIIRKGEIIADRAPAEAVRELQGKLWETSVEREKFNELKNRLSVISSQMFEGRVRVRVFAEGGRPDESFTAVAPSLEDYYFNLVHQSPKVN
jgi:ABC-type multidrug transport system ATPase subunit